MRGAALSQRHTNMRSTVTKDNSPLIISHTTPSGPAPLPWYVKLWSSAGSRVQLSCAQQAVHRGNNREDAGPPWWVTQINLISPDTGSTSVLPDQARAGRLVTEDTSDLLVVGLRRDQFDSYDPGEYDHNSPDYLDFSLNLIGNPQHQTSLVTVPSRLTPSTETPDQTEDLQTRPDG